MLISVLKLIDKHFDAHKTQNIYYETHTYTPLHINTQTKTCLCVYYFLYLKKIFYRFLKS